MCCFGHVAGSSIAIRGVQLMNNKLIFYIDHTECTESSVSLTETAAFCIGALLTGATPQTAQE